MCTSACASAKVGVDVCWCVCVCAFMCTCMCVLAFVCECVPVGVGGMAFGPGGWMSPRRGPRPFDQDALPYPHFLIQTVTCGCLLRLAMSSVLF